MKRFSFTVALGLLATLALLCLLNIMSMPFPVARAAELRVCVGGCPYSSIQAAVDAASDGDVIKVAAGSYTGVTTRDSVTQVVYISKSVTIRGGYTTAFGEPPDPAVNATTVDAQGQGRGLYITGNISPTIEGLRITGGNAAGLRPGGGAYSIGGGVYIVTATAFISGSQIMSNTAGRGGGIAVEYGNINLADNSVFGHTSQGIYVGHGRAMLSGNHIFSNAVGVEAFCADAALTDNWIQENTSSYAAGGVYAQDGSITLTHNTIISNTGANDRHG